MVDLAFIKDIDKVSYNICVDKMKLCEVMGYSQEQGTPKGITEQSQLVSRESFKAEAEVYSGQVGSLG